MRKLKILIIGANGFIGQALCKRLMADGYHVRGAKSKEQRAESGFAFKTNPPTNNKPSYPFQPKALLIRRFRGLTQIKKQKMILKPACHCKARAGRYCG